MSLLVFSLLSSHQCWEIRQIYHITPTMGHLKLKGQSLYFMTFLTIAHSVSPCCLMFSTGARKVLDTDITIVYADYNAYTIMVYKKLGETTLKLFGEALSHVMFGVVSQMVIVVCLRLHRCVRNDIPLILVLCMQAGL